MNAAVSCRQLSPRIGLALLLVFTVLAVPTATVRIAVGSERHEEAAEQGH